MLKIMNTKDLLSPENFKLKMLGYAPSGFGKSRFGATAPNPIFGCCDTGHGGGMLTIARLGLPYIELRNYNDLEEFCSGVNLEQYDTLVLDAFDFAGDTFVKDWALTVPRSGKMGESKKRQMGCPELDDFGVISELMRRCLAKLLSQDKHIYVNAALDYYAPAVLQGENPRPEKIGGPSFVGQLRMGSCAMFDVVLRMFMRPALRDPKDANSKYNQRVWQTEGNGQYLAKSRIVNGNNNAFPPEVVFDLDKGTGTFQWLLDEARKVYATQSVAAA